MKRIVSYLCLCIAMILVTGCASDKYTLTEKEISLEVNSYTLDKDKVTDDTKLFDAFSYLKLDDQELTEDQQKEINIENNVDYSKLGDYTVAYRKDDKDITDTLKVKIVDTTKPIIKLKETEFEVGSDIKEKIELSDNYDDEKTLKENLKIEGYTSDLEGEQKITITVKDSSNNEAKEEFTINLKESEENTSYAESSSNNGSGNNGGGNSGWTNDSGGNSGGSSGGSTPAPAPTPEPTPIPTPPTEPEFDYVCPNGNNKFMPCDYIFAGHVGNGGLYNSYVEAEDALSAMGLTAQNNPIGTVNYNDGTVKYTFSY